MVVTISVDVTILAFCQNGRFTPEKILKVINLKFICLGKVWDFVLVGITNLVSLNLSFAWLLHLCYVICNFSAKLLVSPLLSPKPGVSRWNRESWQVCLWDNFWSEPKKLTPIFFTKKFKMKINHPKTFI